MKAIVVKCLQPTKTQSRRWKADDLDGNSIIVNWSVLTIGGFDYAALMLAEKMGWTGKLHCGQLDRGKWVYVFENLYPIEAK